MSVQDVLREIAPGRVVRLQLDAAQKRALRDADGQLALEVVRHLLGARSALGDGAAAAFPLTEAMFQAVARKLGRGVGGKRARGLVKRLAQAGVIEEAGSYRQAYRNAPGRSGFRVALYKVAASLAALRRKRLSAGPRVSSTPGRARWWQHPLFGNPDGLPPPHLSKRQVRLWRSADELGRAA